MAVLDEVRQQVQRRLDELEPLIAEYRELEQVAVRLGVSSTGGGGGRRGDASPVPAAKASPATDGKTRRTTRRRSSGPRQARSRRRAAATGSRQQDVLRLVNAQPGISVREIGSELGVDPTGLYQIVRRLEGRGVIRKEGRRLRPVATSG